MRCCLRECYTCRIGVREQTRRAGGRTALASAGDRSAWLRPLPRWRYLWPDGPLTHPAPPRPEVQGRSDVAATCATVEQQLAHMRGAHLAGPVIAPGADHTSATLVGTATSSACLPPPTAPGPSSVAPFLPSLPTAPTASPRRASNRHHYSSCHHHPANPSSLARRRTFQAYQRTADAEHVRKGW